MRKHEKNNENKEKIKLIIESVNKEKMTKELFEEKIWEVFNLMLNQLTKEELNQAKMINKLNN